MAVSDRRSRATHLEGGNFFDDMRVDISASHCALANLTTNPRSIKRSKYRNLAKLYLAKWRIRFGVQEFLVVNGITRKWLDDFRRYWSEILNGRPFVDTLDFFLLLHDYRKRQQYVSRLEWSDAERHLAHWQSPNQIYATLHAVRKHAIHPIVCLNLFRAMPKNARVLEYGCSLAPYYHCYREFFSHLDARWTLADIPNFPFHYARFLYKDDAEAELITIEAEDFANPLGGAGDFDVIILTTVLEHLDDPLFVSEYLLDRLNPGGLLVFDYIQSEGTGLDHPKAVEAREDCLKLILEKTQVIQGDVEDISKSIGLCIARRK